MKRRNQYQPASFIASISQLQTEENHLLTQTQTALLWLHFTNLEHPVGTA